MQSPKTPKKHNTRQSTLSPYQDVLTVRCIDQVVQCDDDHTRLLRDPILIPDLRHTGIQISCGDERPLIEAEGLFDENGSPKRTLHKLVAETVRANFRLPAKPKRRPKRAAGAVTVDATPKNLPYNPDVPRRKGPLVYRRPVPKEAFNILRSVRATAKEMDRTIFKK